MSVTDVYITIIITLFGIAYPILLQVIARIDEKYLSENIINLFDKEKEGKFFTWSLIVSLIFILIWTFNLPPIIEISCLNYFINNSAKLLVAGSAIIAIIAFFLYVRKTIKYYSPTKLIKYFISNHNKSENDYKWFDGLSEIFLLSIKLQQINISKTLSGFFYDGFRLEREKQPDEPVEYPDLYYLLVYKAIEELAIKREKRNRFLEYRTAGGLWLFGNQQNPQISEKTYSWFWNNILLCLEYQQDDLILYYWENAYQYYVYDFQNIFEDAEDIEGVWTVKNADEVLSRRNDRKRFIEFQYALCSLLLYEKRYDCLHRIFNHTMSFPPRYELFPESMQDIFEFYFQVRDPYDMRYTWISHKYPFPKLTDLNADFIIKNWICAFMGVLFLRQYTIVPYLITMRPLEFPQLPQTQPDIKEWIDGMDQFKALVTKHLNDSRLMESLHFNFITPQWCIDNHNPYPTDFIDTLKGTLQDAYQTNALTLELDQNKINQFYNSSAIIIQDNWTEYRRINNSSELVEDTSVWFVNGLVMLQSKDAFATHPEVHHTDFDTFLAGSLIRKIDNGVSMTFLLMRTKFYLLKSELIFKGIDKLHVGANPIVIGFGVNKDYYINNLGYSEFASGKYKNGRILFFPGSPAVRNCFYLLDESDLPSLRLKNITQDIIDKYSLVPISELENVYASVIDMNLTSDEIRQEQAPSLQGDELRKSALLSLILLLEIKWKKQVKVIQFSEYSEYRQNGLPNDLNEIVD